MPRQARVTQPGVIVHVICRLVDGRFLFDDEARAEYALRLERSLRRTDWVLLAFCFMSNHLHLVLLSGGSTLGHWMQPLNTGMAMWINRRRRADDRRTLGHVFAERATTELYPTQLAPVMIAYAHNNPGRAEVVDNPAQSHWTSHRIYLGLEPCPPWLDVRAGLDLCGFDDDDAGRAAFHELVCRQAGHPLVVEQLVVGDQAREAPIAPTMMKLEASAVIEVVAAYLEIEPVVLAGRSRGRSVVDGRRLALQLWQEVGGSQREMARTLGIAESSASRLLHAGRPTPVGALAAIRASLR